MPGQFQATHLSPWHWGVILSALCCFGCGGQSSKEFDFTPVTYDVPAPAVDNSVQVAPFELNHLSAIPVQIGTVPPAIIREQLSFTGSGVIRPAQADSEKPLRLAVTIFKRDPAGQRIIYSRGFFFVKCEPDGALHYTLTTEAPHAPGDYLLEIACNKIVVAQGALRVVPNAPSPISQPSLRQNTP